MKAITVKQPYASLICAGIQDILDLDEYTDIRGKVYVYAAPGEDFDDVKAFETMPRCQYNLLDNAMQLGALPCNDSDIVVAHIVGEVEIEDCVPSCQVTDNIWHDKHKGSALILRNPKVLTHPIYLDIKNPEIHFFDVNVVDEFLSYRNPFNVKCWVEEGSYYIASPDDRLDKLYAELHKNFESPISFNSIVINYTHNIGLPLEHFKEMAQLDESDVFETINFISGKRFITIPAVETYYENDHNSEVFEDRNDCEDDYYYVTLYFENERAEMRNLNNNSKANVTDKCQAIPQTKEECFARLDEILSIEDKQRLIEDDNDWNFHFSIGLWIRNNWINPDKSDTLNTLFPNPYWPKIIVDGKEHYVSWGEDDSLSSRVLEGYRKHLRKR